MEGDACRADGEVGDENVVVSDLGIGVTGAELWPAIEALAVWGKTWLPATLSQDEADPDLIMWDLHRRMELERLPQERTTLHFSFTDRPKAKRDRWILCSRECAEFCITDPGFEADPYVATDSRTMTWVWSGVPVGSRLRQLTRTGGLPPIIDALMDLQGPVQKAPTPTCLAGDDRLRRAATRWR